MLAVLALALAWQLGWRLGQRQGHERGTREAREALAVPPPDADARRAAHEADLATLAGERDMARAALATLRLELERAGELAVAERAELELYRRLGGDAIEDGLSIDTLERRTDGGTGVATLLVTLVQARGRDRVRGRVEVRARGSDAPALAGGGAPLDPEPSPDAPASADGDGRRSATFDLRFFETLEIALDGSGDAFPPVIDVRVIPEDARHEPFRRRFRREDIREIE